MIDIAKAKRLLAKINVLVDHYDDSHSRLETDLLKSYIKDLYETILKEETGQPGVEQKTVQVQPEEKEEVIEEIKEAAELSEELDEGVEEAAESIDEMIEESLEQSHRESEIIKEVEITPETPEVADLPDAEPITELAALFDLDEAGDLLSKLGSKSIHRIESAMGINERIFTINELFGGDRDLFQKIVSEINEMESFEQAKDLLIGGVATDQQWASTEKSKKAANFIRLIWRKFTHA